MNTRLLGAAVLIALVVIFVPMFFSRKPPMTWTDHTVTLDIPKAPDEALQTRTISLLPGAANGAGTSTSHPLIPMAASTPDAKHAAADVNADVAKQPDTRNPGRGKAVTLRPVKPNSIPKAHHAAAPPPTKKLTTTTKTATAKPRTASPPHLPRSATRIRYSLNLSAYSSHGAKRLIAKVQALGYPVSGHTVERRGKSLTMVIAGPFATRTKAKVAKLKIAQLFHHIPISIFSTPQHQTVHH